MKCVFVSNYLSHHQLPFCNALYNILGKDFTFVSYEPMSEDRKNLKWTENTMDYEIKSYESKENYDLAANLLTEADVAIISGEPNNFIGINKRLKAGKLTFRFSERIFKKKREIKKVFRVIKHIYKNWGFKNLYLLSGSAYAASDYAKIGLFKDKAFKWGYFPETKKYSDINSLVANKVKNSIIWVGRFIDWKHPEIPIFMAEELKKAGYDFNLTLIGTGVLEKEISHLIEKKDLSDCVKLLGSMHPQQVREYMEKSKIFLFTSDRGEGWGAVLNEAMNSGCVPVASHIIGSAPYLIKNGKNGFLYKDGFVDDLFEKVKYLLKNDTNSTEMSINAYRTITEQWCAENAAERFLQLSENLLDCDENPFLFDSGILSKSEKLSFNWYEGTL